eukprot:gene20673-27464_t
MWICHAVILIGSSYPVAFGGLQLLEDARVWNLAYWRPTLKASINSAILSGKPNVKSDAEDAKKLRAWQGEPETLKAMSAEDLEALERKVEASLASIRAARVKAAASQENACAVCWERKKDTIFQCGHSTCSECGDELTACCICRQPIAIRIRMY